MPTRSPSTPTPSVCPKPPNTFLMPSKNAATTSILFGTNSTCTDTITCVCRKELNSTKQNLKLNSIEWGQRRTRQSQSQHRRGWRWIHGNRNERHLQRWSRRRRMFVVRDWAWEAQQNGDPQFREIMWSRGCVLSPILLNLNFLSPHSAPQKGFSPLWTCEIEHNTPTCALRPPKHEF